MIRAAVAIAIVLELGASARAQGVSPGPLAKDHAALEGIDNCVRCHAGGGNAVTPASCLSCHKALGQRLAAKAGYHAQLAGDCGPCHADHRGLGADLVNWPGGRDHFDHDRAGYKLTGGHAKVACRDCHKPAFLSGPVASALTADERPRTYLGLATACASCHADVHKPSLGSDCAKCHTAASWHDARTSTAFDHGKTKYPLLGAHAKVECTKCHGQSAQKLADLHPKFDTCKTCHQDPHAGAMGTAPTACATCHGEASWKELHYDRQSHAPRTLPLVGGHATPACAACHGDKNDRKPAATCAPCHADPHKPSLGTRCEACHQVTTWTTIAAGKVAFHDRTSYPLRGAHVTVTCDRCHDPKKPEAKRFRPIAHGKCLDCHADPHLGESSQPCEACHVVERWKPAKFELADHAKTRFALDGAHRAVPCAKCHPGPPKSPGFNQGNPACEACHADPHGGQFKDKGTCATCHRTAAWSPSTYTKDLHAKAGFALTGKHDVACGRCHAKQFVGVATECSACHVDRHAGQFATRACTTCHAGAVWKPTPGFDHAKTFPLRGRHATATCERCHPKLQLQVSPGATIETEVYTLGARSHDCTGCHRSPHGLAGSPLAAATGACATCHVETAWRELTNGVTFDHATTGAPLVGGHARTPCTSCHQATRLKVPALAQCTGCHQDRHGGRLGDRCESCHSPTSWKQDQLLVEHQRTRLPLIGAHAVQACSACHQDAQAGTYRGLDPTCRGCHFHTVAEQRPHPDHTKGGFEVCENCHSALGWLPAQLNHNVWWSLTGKHLTTPCVQCHKPADLYSAAPTACSSCHSLPPPDPGPDHGMFPATCGDVRQCQTCHTASGWSPARLPCHPQFSTSHHGAGCSSCHTTPSMLQLYTCRTGACHRSDPSLNHEGGSPDCARMGCHFGGAHGG